MINVQCFAHLREKFGQNELTVDHNRISVKKLLEELAETYSLQTDSFMVAVNEEYADQDDIVKAGDTVALIPPVSGG